MPKELIAVAPRQPELREYEDPPLKPGQVRIKSLLSAEKHGTTLPIYRGTSPVSEKVYDSKLGLFFPKKEATRGWTAKFPMPLGNMTVGIITEVGEGVENLKVGDRVFGHLPIRETHTVDAQAVHPAPPGISDEALVCVDPAMVALMGVREGNVRLGDKVAVFGAGAIGLMAVQMAKLSGAVFVAVVEPIPIRRELALHYGADLAIDPTREDPGVCIRKATGDKGVDVAIETSGAYPALHQAIRATAYGGTIVPVSFYSGEAKGLHLGEEWHFNRQVMVSGARVESEPYRDHPRWNRKRVEEVVLELFRSGKLTVEGILKPVVPIEQAVEAYRLIDEHPEESIKLGVTY